MIKYRTVDIPETHLEDLIRQEPGYIEDGLIYVDHQRRTGQGRLDVLFVDSGKALVVAELKIDEDDGMLAQGIDYYDYITSNIEGYARAFKDKNIDPTQKARLFLIAPEFSTILLNRCKWIDIPISLFTFQCIEFLEDPKGIVSIFKEITIPARTESIEVYTKEQHLDYVTDSEVRKKLEQTLEEIQEWDPDKIHIKAIQDYISIKIKGRVIAYIGPRRKHFVISTNDSDDNWKDIPVNTDEDLEQVISLVRSNYDILK